MPECSNLWLKSDASERANPSAWQKKTCFPNPLIAHFLGGQDASTA